MNIFIIIIMLIVTVYGITEISENGRAVKIGNTTSTRHLTSVGCITVAIITVAYDIVSLYLLLKVV